MYLSPTKLALGAIGFKKALRLLSNALKVGADKAHVIDCTSCEDYIFVDCGVYLFREPKESEHKYTIKCDYAAQADAIYRYYQSICVKGKPQL